MNSNGETINLLELFNYSKIDPKDSTNLPHQTSGHDSESEGEEKNMSWEHVETTEQDNVYERDEKDMSWENVETSQQDNESEGEEKYKSWGQDDETMSWDNFVELQKRCVQIDVHDKK